MDCSPPGSSVHGISQARILEWVMISFSRGSSQPRDQTPVFCIGRQILYLWASWEAHIKNKAGLFREKISHHFTCSYKCTWVIHLSKEESQTCSNPNEWPVNVEWLLLNLSFPASKIRIILGPPEVAVTDKSNNASPNTQQVIGFNDQIIIDTLY